MLSPTVQDFLNHFYALPNLLVWDKINTGGYGDKFKPYLARLEGNYPSFTVLPYMEQDKSFTWFAIAFNDTSFTQVREVIRSLLGSHTAVWIFIKWMISLISKIQMLGTLLTVTF